MAVLRLLKFFDMMFRFLGNMTTGFIGDDCEGFCRTSNTLPFKVETSLPKRHQKA